MADVAALAGVSTATVSRCLNTPESVRPALRQKVESAVATLGYVRHGAARALRSQRSWTIGAIIPTIDNAIFASGVEALQRRLREAGYTLLLASSDYEERQELEEVGSLIARGVDGLTLVGQDHPTALYQILERKRIPYVKIWSYDATDPHPCIGFDNREAAERIAGYLLDIGHREIAMIAGITRGNDRATQRVEGVRRALAGRGLDLPPDRLVERRYDISEGRAALALLASRSPRPTAVVCGNDILAFGALFECRSLGLRVPQDISITGFDDLTLASHVEPPLTTAHVPSRDMGRAAADFLLARIAGESVPERTKMEVGLIVRASTGPPGDRP